MKSNTIVGGLARKTISRKFLNLNTSHLQKIFLWQIMKKFVSFLFRFYFPEWKNRQLKSVERFVAENFPNLFIQQMGLSSNEKKNQS